MKFDCYLDQRRFWFILPVIAKSGMIDRVFPEKIRKTGCFYSEKLNIYIVLIIKIFFLLKLKIKYFYIPFQKNFVVSIDADILKGF